MASRGRVIDSACPRCAQRSQAVCQCEQSLMYCTADSSQCCGVVWTYCSACRREKCMLDRNKFKNNIHPHDEALCIECAKLPTTTRSCRISEIFRERLGNPTDEDLVEMFRAIVPDVYCEEEGVMANKRKCVHARHVCTKRPWSRCSSGCASRRVRSRSAA